MTSDYEKVTVERKTFLENLLQELRRQQSKNSNARRLFLGAGILIAIGIPITSLYYRDIYILLGLVYALLCLAVYFLLPTREFEVRILDVQNELDLLRSAYIPIEQRAQKLFKLHQFELRKYYDQTLKQSAWIFVVGITCILFGFAIIGITLRLVFTNPSTTISDDVVLASFGAVGAILSNFIAVIYLRMYSETIKSMTKFHGRLVGTHHLHFGNFLAAKIDDPTLREKTLAEMASSLSKQANAAAADTE